MIDVVVFFFLLGVLARLVKSDLRLPEALYETLSIYLLLAIGLKGGIELSKQPLLTLAPQVLACMALGFVIPLVLYPLARSLRREGIEFVQEDNAFLRVADLARAQALADAFNPEHLHRRLGQDFRFAFGGALDVGPQRFVVADGDLLPVII